MVFEYIDRGLVDCSIQPDLDKLRDKSVIVTGGSSGFGAAYVKAFLDAGAFVTNADINPNKDQEGKSNYQFCKCDVTSWQDQLAVFKAAVANSPEKSLDVVIANAGTGGRDSILQLEDSDEPTEPTLKTIKVNFVGVIYTAKMNRATSVYIIEGSLASNLNLPGGAEYQKLQIRSGGDGYILPLHTLVLIKNIELNAIINHHDHGSAAHNMCCLRTSSPMRVNLLALWWARTGILSDSLAKYVDSMLKRIGSQWVEFDDAARACLRIATDESIQGRGFIICSREMDKNGYADMAADDYNDRDDVK